ncbi:MAG: hypothetical protein AAGH76_01265 [Pseudomonadota bacterium]
MNRGKTVGALLALVLTSSSVYAQDVTDDRRKEFNRKTKTTKVEQSMEQTFDVELPMKRMTEPCAGQVELEYDQYDTIARVNAKLTDTQCEIESASYTLVINISDNDYNVSSVSHALEWSADGDADFPGSGDFSIGADVDLVNVRARQFKCRCRKNAAADSGD